MKRKISFLFLYLPFFLFFSPSSLIGGENRKENKNKGFAQQEKLFVIMGYLPSWKPAFTPDWDKITHVCLAFGKVESDGFINMEGIDRIKHSIDEAKSHNVKVLLSIGGGQTRNFSAAILNKKSRQKLIKNIVRILGEYTFDGIDIDFEEWDGGIGGAGESDEKKQIALENLYKNLRKTLGNSSLITAAVSGDYDKNNNAWGSYNCYNENMHKYLDFVNLMIYDQTGPWSGTNVGAHSDWEFFEKSITHWMKNKKVPAEKIIAGVPFYGYHFLSRDNAEGAKGMPYREIVSKYALQDAHLKDNVELVFYDGIRTMEQKSKYVKENNLGGIMIWELSGDSENQEESLLRVIHKILNNKSN